MESILYDLYHNRSEYFTRDYSKVPGYAEAKAQADELLKKMKDALPESKHTLLYEYEKITTTLFCLSCTGEFLSGYRFGMQLTIEGLADGRHPADFVIKDSAE